MKKIILLFFCCIFLSACIETVDSRKFASLDFYLHGRFVYEPVLTEKFKHEYLKNPLGFYDIATHAPPAFVFRNSHGTILFYRDAVITIVSSGPTQIRRSTTKTEQSIYDEFASKYLR